MASFAKISVLTSFVAVAVKAIVRSVGITVEIPLFSDKEV
jgi:hypothetical protein